MALDIKLPRLWEEEKKRKPIRPRVRQEILTSPKKCMWCRKQPSQQIHHIDGNPLNNNPNNLIALCGTCHVRATREEISKGQLRRRLGIKKQKSKPKQKRHKTPSERLAKKLKRDFGL